MTAIRSTIFEVLVVVAIGCGVAFAGNSLRSKGQLRWSKNYFDRGSGQTRIPANNATKSATSSPDDSTALTKDSESGGTAHAPEQADSTTATDHPDHDYQEILFDDVLALLNHEDTDMGLNIFVDARKLEQFEEGHIPGAIQANHYEIENFAAVLLERAGPADKVVVYCNGGDCEDSIFMCTDLFELGVPKESIYLYVGGWEEWASKGARSEIGSGM